MLIYCLVCGVLCLVLVLFCKALSVVTSLVIIFMRKRELVALLALSFYYLVTVCYCSVARGSVGLSAVCDCGVFRSYSLTFCNSDF